METEIEAKWLNIDVAAQRKLLEKAGAVCVQLERSMMRSIFDYPDKRLEKVGGWVRVRDEGNKITLSYKQLNDRTLHGTKEVSVVVDNFETTCNFLRAIGLERVSIQETKRESWKLGDTEVEIDTWPWIPSFVEIEAKTEAELRQAAVTLGFDMVDALHGSVETAYQAVYDVTEHDVGSWQEIRFGAVPDWLAAKAKK